MAFEIGSAIARIKADTSDFQKGIGEVGNKTNALGSLMMKLGGIIATTFAVSKIIGFGKQASQEAINFERAMISLEIISDKFGVSADVAKQKANELGRSLRIGVGASAESLQNLLKSGLSLDQATELMKRFTNEAITGKSANLTLAQAVQNLSFAYATNNSALGNMSGMAENWSDIVERGRQALIDEGMAVKDITDDMAKLRGTMDLTNLTMGSAERFTGTLIDKQAELDIKILDLKVAVGDILNPVIAGFVDTLAIWVDKIVWVVENKDILIEKITKFKDIITVVASFLAITFIPAIVMMGIQSLKTAIVGMATLILKTISFALEGWKAIAMLVVKIIKIGIATAAFILHTTVTIAQTVAQIALTAATWLFNVALAVLTSPIFLVVAAIVALIAIGVLLIKNWDKVKAFGKEMLEKLGEWWEGFSAKLRDVGGKILDAMMWPFEEAKRRIEQVVNWIKDKLDWTKRQSPSVIDIIERGVGLANKAYERLDPGVNPIDTGQLANAGIGSGGMNINIDLSGAYISDDDIGERIGDSIVRKLQKNVRF